METQKFEITAPGDYVTRDGRKAVVTGIDPAVVWGIDGTLDGEKYDSGSGWRSNGQYFGETPHKADIVGPWVEPKAEPKAEPKSFTITGPGEYVTRDGRKAVVLAARGDATDYGISGRLDGQREAWAGDGRYFRHRESECDIVGPWVEEGAVVDAEFVEPDREALTDTQVRELQTSIGNPPERPAFAPEVNGKQRGPEFAVGQTWKTRRGTLHVIEDTANGSDSYPLVSRGPLGGRFYHSPDGRAAGNTVAEFDLVEFVSHPESMTAKDFEVEIAKPEPIAEPVRLSDMQWSAEEIAEIQQSHEQAEIAAFDDDRDEALETMAAALRVLVRALDRHGYAPGSEVADAHRFASLTLEGFEP